MCFPHDAKPPIAPLAGTTIDVERLTLQSQDGTRFMAYPGSTEPATRFGCRDT